MPGAWSTVKVFISSTFRDMEAERDHLVRVVFPKLREKLIKRCIHLVDVDLRWGVTSEQDALDVCREIIDDCRPRFLCILGGRYGWTPPGREESITAQEIRYAALNLLEVKEYRFFYLRDPQVTAAIPKAAAQAGGYREFPLQEEGTEFGPEEARKRAQLRSEKLEAIKQEIIDAGYVPFIYPARWDEAQQRLVDLKSFGDRVYDDLLWSIDDELGGEPPLELDEFAAENAATEVFIRERSASYVVGSRQDLLQKLTAFAEGHGAPNILVISGPPGSGKSALLAKCYRDYLGIEDNPGDPQDLVIPHFIGASPGSTDLRRTLRRFCHEIYYHCNFDSQKQARLSQVNDNDATAQEQREAIEKEFSIPRDLQELHQQFRNFLKQAAVTCKVMLLIDALNQFNEPGNVHGMHWLPHDLPANVRIIVSSLEGHPTLEALRRRGEEKVREEWLGPLGTEDRYAIITNFLGRYHKRMEEEQIAALLGKAESGNPLYLLTALEELRTLGDYEKITQHIKEMPGRVQDLFIWTFQRLENDPEFQDHEGRPLGKKLVRDFASFLGVSRFGLSQTELAELLAPENPGAERPADPQGNVAALVRLLRPYLMYRGELIDFFHGQVRQAAVATYLDQEDDKLTAHDCLATYFERKADHRGDGAWVGKYPRALTEFPYHLAQGRQPGHLQKTLTNFRFLQAKVTAHGPYSLIADYDLAATPGINLEADQQKALGLIQAALRLSANVLFRDPEQLAGQLTGRLLGQESQEIKTFLETIRLTATGPWLRPLAPSLTPAGGPLLRTLTGHAGAVGAVALWPERGWAASASCDYFSRNQLKVWDLETGQEILNAAGDPGPVNGVALWRERGWAVSASGKFFSKFSKNPLKVWDLETGQELHNLAGHTGFVLAVALWPERGWAVSASVDSTLKVWDLVRGKEVNTLIGHAGLVNAVAVWPERGWAVSASVDGTLKVWDLARGKELCTLTGHTASITALAVWPERGWAVSASEDGTLKVWDLKREPGRGSGHNDRVTFVAPWPERGRVVSASGDGTLKVWDLARRQEVSTLRGHQEKITALALWRERGRAMSAAEDGTLKVWDLERGQEVSTLRGHQKKVTTVALWPERGWAVSASEDGSCKVWDLERGEEVRTLTKRRSSWIADVILWPERGWAVLVPLEDLECEVWDLETGQEVSILHAGTASKAWSRAALWPERGWAVFGTPFGTIQVWDLERGQQVQTLSGDSDTATAMAFAQVGWGSMEGNLAGGLLGPVTAVALWPERGWVVAAFWNGSLKVWDLETGAECHTLKGHDKMVTAVTVWPERGWAASASEDGTIRVWDLERGECLATFRGESAFTVCAAVPGSRILAAGELKGRVHFLKLEKPGGKI
jgi:WD40 repeat protein